MKRLISVLVCLALVLCATVTSFAVDPYSLTEGERLYLGHRGVSVEDMTAMSQEEIDELLAPYRAFIRSRTNYNHPSNYIAVTNIPGKIDTEYFHPGTGMIAGSFWNQPFQYDMLNGPGQFASHVLEQRLNYDQLYYYLWGCWDDMAKTHQGVDIKGAVNSNVYSAHTGRVVVAGDKYGTVAIYNATDNVTHYYLHLKSIDVTLNQEVTIGKKLGQVFDTGLDNGAYHLHYEVHEGRTNMSKPTSGLYTLNPYYYMYKDLEILRVELFLSGSEKMGRFNRPIFYSIIRRKRDDPPFCPMYRGDVSAVTVFCRLFYIWSSGSRSNNIFE